MSVCPIRHLKLAGESPVVIKRYNYLAEHGWGKKLNCLSVLTNPDLVRGANAQAVTRVNTLVASK